MFINIFCVILNLFTGRYFSEYINPHIFKQLYEYMTEFAIELYGNIFLPCNSPILFVIPVTLLSPIFSAIFSNPPICHALSSTMLFYFENLGLMAQIKLFQLIKFPKLKIDFH